MGVSLLLARYLAQPIRQRSFDTAAGLRSLSALLVRGDVVLAGGSTRMAAVVRRLTRSPWSHVAMYVGPLEEGPDPRCVVEADVAAGVRAVPLSEFDGQRVRVLRPMALPQDERQRLADWVVARIGAEYDRAHAWALARRLLRLPSQGPSLATGSKFICSTLLAHAFALVGHRISGELPSDFENAPGLVPIAADGRPCQPSLHGEAAA